MVISRLAVNRKVQEEAEYPRDDSNVRHTAPEAVALSS